MSQDFGSRDGYQEITNESYSQVITGPEDQNEKLYITGYKSNKTKEWCYYVVSTLFCGIPFLLCYWYPYLTVTKYSKCTINEADYVLVKDSYNIYSVHSIKVVILTSSDSIVFRKSLSSSLHIKNIARFFIHNDIKYIWCYETNQFNQLRGWDSGIKYVRELLEDSNGYTSEEQELLLQLHGKNEIEVPVKSYGHLLFTEILHPFYIFQLFSILLWSFDDYLYYAVCVIIITAMSTCAALYTTKKQSESLRDLVKRSAVSKVTVVRSNGVSEEIDSWKLVPGDVIEIPENGCVMACDALLLNGNCIVNESTLTGESAPVTKNPPPSSNNAFDSIILKRHTLFCGTEIIQTRYYGDDRVKAVVINTGFSTAKGELVRTILHPKPVGFKFYEDSLKFVCVLFMLAALGIAYLIYIYITRGVAVETMILDSLDLITIVVPPALPAAMTSGIMYSQSRLLRKNIFCISPPRINICGKLKLLCFDKTGTLTEEGLDLWGVVPCVNNSFRKSVEDPSTMDPRNPLIVAMATCHSLTMIGGKLSGDPLDLSMFAALDWDLEEAGSDTNRYDLLCPTIVKPKYPNFKLENTKYLTKKYLYNKMDTNGTLQLDYFKPISKSYSETAVCSESGTDWSESVAEFPYEIGIVRDFPFTSVYQCMSVITRILGENHMSLYCKGAPEKISDLCVPDTREYFRRNETPENEVILTAMTFLLLQVPKNFSEELQKFTSAGFRVIGLAYKHLDQKFNWRKSQRVKREDVEHGLIFLGFLVMQNKLKQMTTPVMKELRAANIRCVMITGDNLLTAISVSRDCLMVLPDDVIVQVNVVEPNEAKTAGLSFDPIGTTDRSKEIYEEINSSLLDYSKHLESNIDFSGSNRFHYALDGRTWALLRIYFSEFVPRIIVRGTIFARMLPEQKTQLIEAFQELDYVVGMCGDGANDCGALKAAHIGVSLSEAESSVAAPFTSKVADISCVAILIREGRCALVTSFVIFKYMAIYSLIQFISVLILYTKGIDFGNMEFLYLDLVITTSLAVVIGRSGPASSLAKTSPIASLVSLANVIPLLLQIVLIFFIQLSALAFLHFQEWFIPVNPTVEEVTTSWENTVIFCISSFQYLILALVYSKGKPHREPFYKDFWFMITLTILSALTTLLCLYPIRPLAEFFEIVPVDKDDYQQSLFRIQLLIFPAINLAFSFLIEVSTVNRKWFKKLVRLRKRFPKNRYKQILMETTLQPSFAQNNYC